MKCKKCGEEIGESVLFCRFCGQEVDTEVNSDESKAGEAESVNGAETVNEDESDSEESGQTDNTETQPIVPELTANDNPPVEIAEPNNQERPSGKKTVITVAVAAVLAVVAISCLTVAGIIGYNYYMDMPIKVDVPVNDYKTTTDAVLAFNYQGSMEKGELYLVKDNDSQKIADNVATDEYYLNPANDAVVYKAVDGKDTKWMVYSDGDAKELGGEPNAFGKDYVLITKNGRYMLYTMEKKGEKIAYFYDFDTGDSKKIASGNDFDYEYDANDNAALFSADDRLYYVDMSEDGDVEKVGSKVTVALYFGSGVYAYKRNGDDTYKFQFKNANDTVDMDFEKLGRDASSDSSAYVFEYGGASSDGQVAFFPAKTEQDEDYSVYAVVQGFDEPVRLVKGTDDSSITYKEAENKLYVKKDDNLYVLDLPARTRRNMKNPQIYYDALRECEAVKLVTDISSYDVMEDGKTVVALNDEDVGEDINDREPNCVIIRDDKAKKFVADNIKLINESVVYIVRENDKNAIYRFSDVENADLENIEAELICEDSDNTNASDTSKASYSAISYFDKTNDKLMYDSGDGAKNVWDKSSDYDVVRYYWNVGGNNLYSCAFYVKTPELSDVVGKYKATLQLSADGMTDGMSDVLMEITEDNEFKVYTIGEEQGSCKLKKVEDGDNDRITVYVKTKSGSDFEPKCAIIYDDTTYTSRKERFTLISDNSYFTVDFDGSVSLDTGDGSTFLLKKLTDDEFTQALDNQKDTHNKNLDILSAKKVADEEEAMRQAAARAEQERRNTLDSRARSYYTNGVYVSSSETLYSWHGYSYSTTYTYTYSHTISVSDYYVDYDTGDIWLHTGGNPLDAWVVR